MTSPCCRLAAAAGLPGRIDTTSAPLGSPRSRDFGYLRRHLLCGNADPTAHDLAVQAQLLNDGFRHIGGNGEADPHTAAVG